MLPRGLTGPPQVVRKLNRLGLCSSELELELAWLMLVLQMVTPTAPHCDCLAKVALSARF